MVCGGPNMEKSIYQVDKLTKADMPPVCTPNQYLPSWSPDRCIDAPKCSDDEVSFNGYCHWYEADANEQLVGEAN